MSPAAPRHGGRCAANPSPEKGKSASQRVWLRDKACSGPASKAPGGSCWPYRDRHRFPMPRGPQGHCSPALPPQTPRAPRDQGEGISAGLLGTPATWVPRAGPEWNQRHRRARSLCHDLSGAQTRDVRRVPPAGSTASILQSGGTQKLCQHSRSGLQRPRAVPGLHSPPRQALVAPRGGSEPRSSRAPLQPSGGNPRSPCPGEFAAGNTELQPGRCWRRGGTGHPAAQGPAMPAMKAKGFGVRLAPGTSPKPPAGSLQTPPRQRQAPNCRRLGRRRAAAGLRASAPALSQLRSLPERREADAGRKSISAHTQPRGFNSRGRPQRLPALQQPALGMPPGR